MVRSVASASKKSNVKPWHKPKSSRSSNSALAPVRNIVRPDPGTVASHREEFSEPPVVPPEVPVVSKSPRLDSNRPKALSTRQLDDKTNPKTGRKRIRPAKEVPSEKKVASKGLPERREASWDPTERFRPQRTSDLVGNRDAIRSLEEWLDSPQRTHEGRRRSAFLVHGPPGCGKTSVVWAALAERNYLIREWSPADPFATRSDVSQASMGSHFREVYESVVFGCVRAALVLEEVDGISVPLEELLECLERTRPKHNPVLVTCNRFYVPSLRKLRESPLVATVAFRPLRDEDLKQLWARWDREYRLASLAKFERHLIHWTPPRLESEVRACRGDARRLLVRDTEARRLAARDRKLDQLGDQSSFCEWTDVANWRRDSRDRRTQRLSEMSSLWTEARAWMGSRFYEEQLEAEASSDRTLAAASRFIDRWSDAELLHELCWTPGGAEDSSFDGLGDLPSSMQMLLLRQNPHSASARDPRWHLRTSPPKQTSGGPASCWDFPKSLLLQRESAH